jgi:hypothetical protein
MVNLTTLAQYRDLEWEEIYREALLFGTDEIPVDFPIFTTTSVLEDIQNSDDLNEFASEFAYRYAESMQAYKIPSKLYPKSAPLTVLTAFLVSGDSYCEIVTISRNLTPTQSAPPRRREERMIRNMFFEANEKVKRVKVNAQNVKLVYTKM